MDRSGRLSRITVSVSVELGLEGSMYLLCKNSYCGFGEVPSMLTGNPVIINGETDTGDEKTVEVAMCTTAEGFNLVVGNPAAS